MIEKCLSLRRCCYKYRQDIEYKLFAYCKCCTKLGTLIFRSLSNEGINLTIVWALILVA